MHLHNIFSFLVLVTLTHAAGRHTALPALQKRSSFLPVSSSSSFSLDNSKSHSVSLSKIPLALGLAPNEHAQIILQYHLNRGIARLSRMGSEGGKGGRLAREWYVERLRERVQRVMRDEEEEEGGLEKRDWTDWLDWLRRQRAERPVATTTTSSSSTSSSQVVSTTSSVESTATTTTEVATPTPTPTNVDIRIPGESLPLEIIGPDTGYFGTLLVGTPPAPYRLLMDSGSADFWIGTPSKVHRSIDENTSASFVDTGKDFSVTYGTGSVSGNIVKDTLRIGDLTLEGHTFGVATKESVEFSADSVPFDGLVGLAKSGLSNQRVLTPIEALREAGLVASAQVGYHLSRKVDGLDDGEITFGSVDSSKFQGRLTEFPNVNKQGFWEGAIDSVIVNGRNLNLVNRTGILDTGTTLLICPQGDADKIHAAIPGAAPDGQGGYLIPCNTTSILSLSFGGTSFAIDPRDLIFGQLGSKGNCASGIAAGTIGGVNQWLVGDTFLKSVYFAHNVDTDTIGLAQNV